MTFPYLVIYHVTFPTYFVDHYIPSGKRPENGKALQLINKALSIPKHVPFEFLLRGEILRTTIGEWCVAKGVGEVRNSVFYAYRVAEHDTRRKRWKSNI